MVRAPNMVVLLLAGTLGLSGCRPGFSPNFEAVLSLAGDLGAPHPDEETVSRELRQRAAALPLSAEINPGSPGDARITIRFRATDKSEALAKLDALCESGQLSVRPVHDQTVYLTDAVRSDPSKLPPGYEILTLSLQIGNLSNTENLVVSTATILDGSDVERARAVAPTDPTVLISLSVNGGQKLMEATKKMQKGRSRLAIIYDGRIISAPVVADVLASEFTISGFNSFQQAQALATSLNLPLSAELLIESLKPLAP